MLHPIVRLGNGEGLLHGFFTDESGHPRTECSFTSLRLVIENDPEVGTENSRADEVAARLTFISEKKDRIFSIEGWSDTVQPSHLPMDRTAAELKTVRIPIGSTRILDIVLKHDKDPVCYGITNDSYSCGNPLFKCPQWMLELGVHTVRVRLRCANIDQSFALKFRNPENGPLQPLSCEEITRRTPGDHSA